MIFAGTMARRLLLLIACLATVVVLGSWDNRRELQRVLEGGYATTAEITGAQFQRRMPFALDGWWPRFVEQDLSIDLKWQGKDGKPREHRKVPVTESFAKTIVSGDQVQLVTVAVKVQDDDRTVPVVTADSGARLASLQSWVKLSGYLAMFAWAAIAAMGIWQWRRGAGPTAAAAPALFDIPRRPLFGFLALVLGGILAFYGWSAGQPSDSAAVGGVETTAEIIGVTKSHGKEGGAPAYALQLSWKDSQGAVHHYGPVQITEAFWKAITRDGELAVHQTRIRVSELGPQPRPMILADPPETPWQARAGLLGGLAIMAGGIGLLLSAFAQARRPAK
ncbi:MAG: hypothetical protein ACHQK9_00840 [Reyranellales bacterium]